MTVTAIEEYRKNKYKIYLNDAFAFVLYKGDLRHFDISEGKELTDADLEQIRSEVLQKRARMRAMHLLQSRDYTEDAMRRKLKEGLYPQDIIEDAVAYVKQYHYIDDRRYAMSYLEAHAGALSAKQIREKLRLKGISTKLIEECFLTYEEESGTDREEQEMQLLMHQMKKKLNVVMAGSEGTLDHAAKQKLFAAFYRKGFSLPMIEKAYERLLEEIV